MLEYPRRATFGPYELKSRREHVCFFSGRAIEKNGLKNPVLLRTTRLGGNHSASGIERHKASNELIFQTFHISFLRPTVLQYELKASKDPSYEYKPAHESGEKRKGPTSADNDSQCSVTER